MSDVKYIDVNGTRKYPRTLQEAFPNSDNSNPFHKPVQWEIDLDNIFAYIGIFFSGFVLGLAYAYR